MESLNESFDQIELEAKSLYDSEKIKRQKAVFERLDLD